MRKLANLELAAGNFLNAACQFERIRDYREALKCYKKANKVESSDTLEQMCEKAESADAFEQMGDFMLRCGTIYMNVEKLVQIYLTVISILSIDASSKNKVRIKKLYEKINLIPKVASIVHAHFGKLAEPDFPILPQAKKILHENTEIVDGPVDFNEIDGEAEDGHIEGLDDEIARLFGFKN